MGSLAARSIVRSAVVVAATLVVAAACTTGGGASSSPTAASSAAPAVSTASSAPTSPGGGKYGNEDGSMDGDEYAARTSSPAASGGGGVGEVHEVGVGNGADGAYLTGEDGRTLYVFGNDSANTSACEGDCATAWPPFILADDDKLKAGEGVKGKLTTFVRTDGSMQAAYDGSPLYYYAGDQTAGDTNGHGVRDVWFIAQP